MSQRKITNYIRALYEFYSLLPCNLLTNLPHFCFISVSHHQPFCLTCTSLHLSLSYCFFLPFSEGENSRQNITPWRKDFLALSSTPLKKTIERSLFFIGRGGHCCRGDLVGRTTSDIFFFCVFQKLEFGRCSLFLPGWAKDLSAHRYLGQDTGNQLKEK